MLDKTQRLFFQREAEHESVDLFVRNYSYKHRKMKGVPVTRTWINVFLNNLEIAIKIMSMKY